MSSDFMTVSIDCLVCHLVNTPDTSWCPRSNARTQWMLSYLKQCDLLESHQVDVHSDGCFHHQRHLVQQLWLIWRWQSVRLQEKRNMSASSFNHSTNIFAFCCCCSLFLKWILHPNAVMYGNMCIIMYWSLICDFMTTTKHSLFCQDNKIVIIRKTDKRRQ